MPVTSLFNNEETIRELNDKWRFFNLCNSLKLPLPKTKRCEDMASLRQHGLNYPIFTKPSNHGGGLGIHELNSPVEIQEGLFKAGENSRFKDLIVQEKVYGEDFQVLIFAKKGQILSASMCLMRKKAKESFFSMRIFLMI